MLCGDGEFGAARYGPFDRIVVTVGTWGIPSAWVEQLVQGGRLVAPQAVFAADSAVALAQLTIIGDGETHPFAVVAASFTDLAAAFTGSLTNGLNWLTDHISQHPAPAFAREVHRQAMRLADPHGDWAAKRALSGGERLALSWVHRRSALATYRAHVGPAEGLDPDQVLASLLHLHHARVVGINQDSERICLRLARTAALGWVAHSCDSFIAGR